MTTSPTLRWKSIVLENAQKPVELGGGGGRVKDAAPVTQPDQSSTAPSVTPPSNSGKYSNTYEHEESVYMGGICGAVWAGLS